MSQNKALSVALAVAAVLVVGVTAATIIGGGHAPTPAPIAPIVRAPVAPAAVPLAIALSADSVQLSNLTDRPLERCLVRTAGDLAGEIPFVAPHASESRLFTAIFGSDDASREAHMAGYTFEGYVQAMAATRTTASCRDSDGAIVRAQLKSNQ